MEHVVFFPGPEGSPAFRRVAGVEDAVRLVEHLRNVEGVADVAVHPLGAEVPLAFRTWYRVELPQQAAGQLTVPQQAAEPGQEGDPVQPVGTAGDAEPVSEEAPTADPAVVVPQVEQPVLEPVANGSGESPKSLGFFAT